MRGTQRILPMPKRKTLKQTSSPAWVWETWKSLMIAFVATVKLLLLMLARKVKAQIVR